MARGKCDPWATTDKPRTDSTANYGARSVSTSVELAEEVDSGTDLPVQIIVVYKSGRLDNLIGERLKNFLARMNTPRTGRHATTERTSTLRLWRLNVPMSMQQESKYLIDEEVLNEAKSKGLIVSDPVAAGKALNYVAEYYKTDSAGKLMHGADGRLIRATSAEYNPYRRPAPAGDGATAQSST